MTPAGFPHSDIHGSTPACGSPWLIAANHVLHRLLTPRHPPSALTSLTTNLSATPQTSVRFVTCGVEAKVLSEIPQRISHSRQNKRRKYLIRASSYYSVVNEDCGG
jgi:hypothetical protein